VADFRDPWVGLYLREPPTAWHRARQAALERAVLGAADVTLVASRTHAAAAGARSLATPRRVEWLPNGFEPAGAGGPRPVAATDRSAGGGRCTLVWTGTLSQMPDAEVLFEALHELFARHPEARRTLRVRFLGPYDSNAEDRALALGLAGIVEFAGPRPHAETRAAQAGADALLLWKPRGMPTMVPGKLYEYLDAGRPVLAVLEADDEAAHLVRRAGGEVTPPGDRTALAAALERRWRARVAHGPTAPARPDWLEEHARPRLAARLARLLDGLAEGRR
jgi:hypothetical protein